jgi:hypothetical protein
MSAVPASAESERRATSLAPNRCTHAQPRTKYSGGAVSTDTMKWSIDPSDSCSS